MNFAFSLLSPIAWPEALLVFFYFALRSFIVQQESSSLILALFSLSTVQELLMVFVSLAQLAFTSVFCNNFRQAHFLFYLFYSDLFSFPFFHKAKA